MFIVGACIDSDDYDIDKVSLKPSVALPLVTGSLSIDDILSDDDADNVKVYPDGLVYLSYRQQLKAQSIRELFEVPNKSITRSFVIPAGTLPATTRDIRLDSIIQEVDLELSPEQLSEIRAKGGRIDYSTSIIPASSSLQYEIATTFADFRSNTTNQPLSTIARGTGSLSLANHTMFLDRNKFDMKLVLIIKRLNAPTTIAPGTSVSIRLDFLDIDFTSIRGFFGTQTASLPADEIDINVFENSFGGATVSLAQPKIEMTVVNDNGVPCQVNFKMLEARKGSGKLALQLNPANPVNLNIPSVLGTSSTTNVTVTNAKQVLDFAPTSFFYQADATINSGVTSGNNFLADTSQLRVNMNIEVPLYGSVSNVVIRDTVGLDLSDVDESDISSASLKLKLVNEMPLNGDIQLVLTDEQYKSIGVLLPTGKTNIVRASQVNPSGELLTAGTYEDLISLPQETLNVLFNARHLIVVATMNTTRGTNGAALDVKFKRDYSLSVDVGILANLDLTIE